MTTSTSLDELDHAIIKMLTEDGRLSASNIAARIGNVTERTVRNRIAALLEDKHIFIGAIPDAASIGKEVQADVLIDVEPGRVQEVALKLAAYDEIGYLAATTGKHALGAAIFFATNTELFDFAENVVGKIPGVRGVEISLVLRLYKVYGSKTNALLEAEESNVARFRKVGRKS